MSAPNPYDVVLIECPTCEGAGEVHFNNSRNRDPQCDDSYQCPTCEGTGEAPEGTEPYDEEAARQDAADEAAELRAEGW